MTPDDHVLRLHVFVEGNPEPVAATYHFGARAGKAEMSTRFAWPDPKLLPGIPTISRPRPFAPARGEQSSHRRLSGSMCFSL